MFGVITIVLKTLQEKTMSKRLTREELEKQLSIRDQENQQLYQENLHYYEKEGRARAEGYKEAMRDVIELLRDVFGKKQ